MCFVISRQRNCAKQCNYSTTYSEALLSMKVNERPRTSCTLNEPRGTVWAGDSEGLIAGSDAGGKH
jgi:hypothetical protein